MVSTAEPLTQGDGFGAIEELNAPEPVTDQSPLLQSRLLWRPSDAIRTRPPHRTGTRPLPDGLILDALKTRDGEKLRLIAPYELADFTALGKLWGSAILQKTGVWSYETGKALDLNWFLFQKSQRTQAFLKRAFRSVKDLRVSRKAQQSVDSEHILSVSYQGQPLDEVSLLKLGEKLANDRQVRPSVATKIRLGLYACAKDNPRPLVAEEVSGLVRQALFDSVKAPAEVDQEIINHLKTRARSAIEEHGDHTVESLEEFHEWLWGPGNTFLPQLAKQKKQPGGQLDRQVALAAMVQLGWEGIQQLAECVEALMRSVANNLPEEYQLTGESQKVYELLYYRQDRLGGLSLIMLKDRFPFAREAILDLMNSPDDEQCFQVFYRLLSDYAFLASQRRQVDRLAKQPHVWEFQETDQSVEPDGIEE